MNYVVVGFIISLLILILISMVVLVFTTKTKHKVNHYQRSSRKRYEVDKERIT